jgi:hypothetical protein
METRSNQKQWIINILLEKGFITRNYALQNYISRLAGHINQLKKEGWEFDTDKIEVTTQWGKGYNYRYTVTKIGEDYA